MEKSLKKTELSKSVPTEAPTNSFSYTMWVHDLEGYGKISGGNSNITPVMFNVRKEGNTESFFTVGWPSGLDETGVIEFLRPYANPDEVDDVSTGTFMETLTDDTYDNLTAENERPLTNIQVERKDGFTILWTAGAIIGDDYPGFYLMSSDQNHLTDGTLENLLRGTSTDPAIINPALISELPALVSAGFSVLEQPVA
jgi:hypothetical protein